MAGSCFSTNTAALAALELRVVTCESSLEHDLPQGFGITALRGQIIEGLNSDRKIRILDVWDEHCRGRLLTLRSFNQGMHQLIVVHPDRLIRKHRGQSGDYPRARHLRVDSKQSCCDDDAQRLVRSVESSVEVADGRSPDWAEAVVNIKAAAPTPHGRLGVVERVAERPEGLFPQFAIRQVAIPSDELLELPHSGRPHRRIAVLGGGEKSCQSLLRAIRSGLDQDRTGERSRHS